MVQAKATTHCNSLDQQEVVDKSSNTPDNRPGFKSVAQLQENKAHSISVKSGYMKRHFR